MKIKEVQIGKTYVARVGGNLVKVKVLGEDHTYEGQVKFNAINTSANRTLIISAARLRYEWKVPGLSSVAREAIHLLAQDVAYTPGYSAEVRIERLAAANGFTAQALVDEINRIQSESTPPAAERMA